MAITCFSACGGNNGDNSSDNNNANIDVDVNVTATLTVDVKQGQDEYNLIDSVAKIFRQTYKNVTVKALNIHGKPFILEAKDGSLLARAIQHEFDHLDGILFIDHSINRFEAEEALKQHNLPPLQIEKLIDEPDLTAQVNELKAKQIEDEKA